MLLSYLLKDTHFYCNKVKKRSLFDNSFFENFILV